MQCKREYIQLLCSYDKGEGLDHIEGAVEAALSGDLTEIDVTDHNATSTGPLTKTVSMMKKPNEMDYMKSMTVE